MIKIYAGGKIVSLSFDGWSNIHNDAIVCACVTTEKGTVFFTETIDTLGNTLENACKMYSKQ